MAMEIVMTIFQGVVHKAVTEARAHYGRAVYVTSDRYGSLYFTLSLIAGHKFILACGILSDGALMIVRHP